ncbi:MAG: hydroxyethylthiazole kinase, partial [Treponemataceae bacterium]
MFKSVFSNVQHKKPLVHAITNYVTVNDCANIILACAASPIMADNQAEAYDIIQKASSLYINTGTPTEQSIQGMLCAGKEANKKGIPVILDPVGVGASQFRNDLIEKLLSNINFS